MRQISQTQRKIDLTFLLKMRKLVFTDIAADVHIDPKVLGVAEAFLFLALIFWSAPPSLLTILPRYDNWSTVTRYCPWRRTGPETRAVGLVDSHWPGFCLFVCLWVFFFFFLKHSLSLETDRSCSPSRSCAATQSSMFESILQTPSLCGALSSSWNKSKKVAPVVSRTCPDCVHLVSHYPSTGRLYCFLSAVISAVFPATCMVRTLHVPSWAVVLVREESSALQLSSGFQQFIFDTSFSIL